VQNQIGAEAIGEVVVSENAGNRRTEQLLHHFPALPVRFLFREPTLPMLAHLFSTIRLARTPFVAILNDDDWWGAGHVADGLRHLQADAGIAAYTAASAYVACETYELPAWIDRSPVAWLLAGRASWLSTWSFDPQAIMALCWMYTPFHISSLIARTDSLLSALDELEPEIRHVHTFDCLLFAKLALRGSFRYNPVADTFVRWHEGNWVKSQTPETVKGILRDTARSVEDLASRQGWNLRNVWRTALSVMPPEVELDVLRRFRMTFNSEELERLGFASFFHKRPSSGRLAALRNIAANTKRLVLGCP
jgi:hypothetical protein